jgi:hypothetical protein
VQLESQVVVEGRPVSGEVGLLYKLEADHKRKLARVWLGGAGDGDTRPSTVETGVVLTPDPRTGRLRHCQLHTAYIKVRSQPLTTVYDHEYTRRY